jgi:hypothetical protein
VAPAAKVGSIWLSETSKVKAEERSTRSSGPSLTRETKERLCAIRASWLTTTPLGFPVEPEV